MNIKKIEKLVQILERSIVSEIELTDVFGRKVKISKSSNASANTQTQIANPVTSKQQKIDQTEQQEANDTRSKPNDNTVTIKSPIVGTFYRSPAPDAPPYVEVGDSVKPGKVVCIVEAMKLMNEIESDVEGKITKILVKNEDPVEYNQDLFLVDRTL